MDRHLLGSGGVAILPALGGFKVRKLHRGTIKTFLAEKQASGLSVDSVRLIHAALRGILNAAVEDEVIRTNPASGLGRVLRLSRSSSEAFKRALRAAELPGHFSCHSLRHTYASLLLAGDVSPAYVQEQLGHASIELTVGTYGRWLRKKAPGALDILDGGKVVAENPETVAGDGPEGPRHGPETTEVAEREGFEPSVEGLPLHVISSHADSATLASLRR